MCVLYFSMFSGNLPLLMTIVLYTDTTKLIFRFYKEINSSRLLIHFIFELPTKYCTIIIMMVIIPKEE